MNLTKKKTKKNWDSWDSTKKPVKRFWDSTEKRFFGFQFFSHRIPSFFSGIPGFWTKKSTIFVISATLDLTLSTSTLLVMKWSEKKWKWSEDKKVLWFSWNLYILYIMYIPITKTEEKCAGQLSYGFNIQDKLEGCTHEKKIPYGDLDFWNFVYKRFRVIDR